MIIVGPGRIIVDPGDDGDGSGGGGVATAEGFGLSLTGVDGSVWDLNNGPVIAAPGVTALAAPDAEHLWKVSPTFDGARWKGMRTPQREVILPVYVLADDWQSWRELDGRWFRAIQPVGECDLAVSAPDGATRWLALRFVAGGDLPTSPNRHHFAAYTLEFVAASPYWRGEVVSRGFMATAPAAFFPGPPFTLNAASVTQDSTVTNPGDVAVWPRYVVRGPATSFALGVGASQVASSTALTAAQSITVDTDPARLSILDQGGVDAYERMTAVEFAPIPPGVDVPLSLSVSGATSASNVSVEFTPLFRRPW